MAVDEEKVSLRVGIFWLYRHKVIFMHSVPLEEGQA